MKSYASILKPQTQESVTPAAQSGVLVSPRSPLARAAAGCVPGNGLIRLPVPLVQNLFLPAKKTLTDTFLTPESKKQADKPGGRTPINFSAEKNQLVEQVGLTFLKDVPVKLRPTASRSLVFEDFRASAQNAKSHGELHCLAAKHTGLFQTFSDSILIKENAIPIQKFTVEHLKDPEHAAAANDFMHAMQDLTGQNFDQPEHYWPYMTGYGDAARKNHLLTIVDIEGVGQLRFMSVSGLNEFPRDAKTRTLSIPVGGELSSLGSIRCKALPKSNHKNKCAVEVNAGRMTGSNKNTGPIHYLGYNEIVIGSGKSMKEARVLPRTKTRKPDGSFHDRCRDTEYSVFSGLCMLMRAKKGWLEKPMKIVMYSRLPMCPACQNAATHAILRPEFKDLKSFSVYSGS